MVVVDFIPKLIAVTHPVEPTAAINSGGSVMLAASGAAAAGGADAGAGGSGGGVQCDAASVGRITANLN